MAAAELFGCRFQVYEMAKYFTPFDIRQCPLNILDSQLQNEEEPGEGSNSASDAPPPYSSIAADSAAFFDYKDESGFPKPPSYNVATSLPSYDEAERTKAEATVPLVSGRDDEFVARDDFDDADQLRIGNDGIFMLTFFSMYAFSYSKFNVAVSRYQICKENPYN
ncbi:NFIP1 protein, partial [Polypterus senegalus]